MSTVWGIAGALLLLEIIVVAHEFGHFMVARALKIRVLEFAIGMGPKIVAFTKNNTKYSLRCLPIGGYCKFVGDDDQDYDSPDAMNNQPAWKRFLTIFAGPVMNFVLAYMVVFIYITMLGVPAAVPKIFTVEPTMPAAVAGLMPGDIVAEIDGESIPYNNSGAALMRAKITGADSEKGVSLTISRDGQTQSIRLVPEQQEDGSRLIGIVMDQERMKSSVSSAFEKSFYTLYDTTRMMLDALKNLVFKGEGLGDTMGPVGIIGFMSVEIRNGWDQICNLLVLISLNLGIMNLLPLPALDGGRLVFILIEWVIGRPVKPEFEGWVHAGGFLLLMGVMVATVFHDILRMMGKA